MSSVSSVGSSFSTSSTSQSEGTGQARRRRGGDPLAEDLTSYMTQLGVSANDQKQILSEIKEALAGNKSTNAANANGSSSRPDPSQVLKTVSTVLQAHGLSGDDFAQSNPPPPPPPSGSGKPRVTSDQDSLLQKMLDILAAEFKKAQEKQKAQAQAAQSNSQSTQSSTNTTDPTGATTNPLNADGTVSNSPYAAILELVAAHGEFNATA